MLNPKISIITATFNNRQTIESTLLSVHSQTYKNIEHIVIDGLSTDGTVEIIEKYRHNIQVFISEKDHGVYDALNKGLRLASGQIIGFLHADDFFYSPNTLQLIAQSFENQNIVAVYGDLLYVKRNNPHKTVRYWKSQPFNLSLLSKGWMPAHPTLFFQRSAIDQIGLFDTHYRIAADYDFMLRLLKHYPPTAFLYLPHIITCMRVGGKSNRSLKNIMQKSKEDYAIIRKHQIGSWATLFLKNFSKITQFIKPQIPQK